MVATSKPALATPEPVFGSVEAARALGISVSYIEKLRASGKAQPSIPKGDSGRMLYSVADLRRLAHVIGRNLNGLEQSAA